MNSTSLQSTILFMVRHFDKNTSNIGEAEISALKKHGYGPAPQDGIDQASVKVHSRTDQRHRFRMTGAAKNMSSQRSNEVDRDNSVPQLCSYPSNFLFNSIFWLLCLIASDFIHENALFVFEGMKDSHWRKAS